MEAVVFHHDGLTEELDSILYKMECVESWGNKMAVYSETEETFEFPHGISIEEDFTYWYEDEDKRDEDFYSLVEILNEKSENFFY